MLINDLRRHAAANAATIRSAVERVISSGWYIMGAECSGFEEEFAAYCSTNYCITVGNGTDAIEIALRALGVKAGDRVATVANAGFYTTAALISIGAIPVYIDVERISRLMDIEQMRLAISKGDISALVITHLYGLMHDMERVISIAQDAGVRVLEDCAQAHGAQRSGRPAGSWGHAGTFSFYPTKNLGCIGDAGAIITQDESVANRAMQLRQYGWETKYRAVASGGRNSRMDEIQAAVLRAKLPHLDSWNLRRRAIAQLYSSRITNTRVFCPREIGEHTVAHLFVITCDDRESLRRHLKAKGIIADVHYPVPDHLQAAVGSHNNPPSLPVTEELTQTILTLPCFPELSDGEVEQVIEAVNGW